LPAGLRQSDMRSIRSPSSCPGEGRCRACHPEYELDAQAVQRFAATMNGEIMRVRRMERGHSGSRIARDERNGSPPRCATRAPSSSRAASSRSRPTKSQSGYPPVARGNPTTAPSTISGRRLWNHHGVGLVRVQRARASRPDRMVLASGRAASWHQAVTRPSASTMSATLH